MGKIDDAVATQERNIEARTGRTMAELVAIVRGWGLVKHREMLDRLKADLGMGHGDANLVATRARETGAQPAAADPADSWYPGPKAALRPIHEAVVAYVAELGPVEHAPKKTYLSLRRSKQLAMVGPATRTQVEVGLNLPGRAPTERLVAASGMCTHKVRLSSVYELDDDLRSWLKEAFELAG